MGKIRSSIVRRAMQSVTHGAACAETPRLVRLTNHRLKPLQLCREIALHVRRAYLNHPIIPRLEPGPARRPVGNNGLALARVDEFDRDPVHEGDEIRNVPADRGLALELAGEAAVAGERLPEQPLGIGRVAAEKAREPANSAAAVG